VREGLKMKKWDIVFWDDVGGPISPSAEKKPMGGSEFGLLTLARGLAASGLSVLVASKIEATEIEQPNLCFAPVDGLGRGYLSECSALVIHRMSSVPDIRTERCFVLTTDMPDPRYRHLAPLFERGAALICLSDWQAKLYGVPRTEVLPLACVPDALYERPLSPKNPRKFVYMSALMKGWEATIDTWTHIRTLHWKCADAELHVSSGWGDTIGDRYAHRGVVSHGLLNPAQQVEMLEDAVGLFYVNTFPETFCGVAAIAEARGLRMHVLAQNDPGALPTTMAQSLAKDLNALVMGFVHAYKRAMDDERDCNDWRVSSLIPKYRHVLLEKDFGRAHEVSTTRQSTICLTMIVKNGAETIARCLASARPFIDAWCIIVDPLTTDGTREIIHTALDGIPGLIYEVKWEGFDKTRTQGLRFAEKIGTDYLLTIDADDMFEGTIDRSNLVADVYLMRVFDVSASYDRPHLFRADGRFCYKGVAHEYLTDPSEGKNVSADLLNTIVYRRLESTRRGTAKHERDIVALREALRVDPSDARSVYYLAQSYADLGKPKKAVEVYRQRALMGGHPEEVYLSLYRVGRLLVDVGAPRGEIEAAFLKAWESRPQRIEALCHLAKYLFEKKQFARAYLYAKTAADAPRPADMLLVEDSWHVWGARFLLSATCVGLGRLREGRALCEALLREGVLPEEDALGDTRENLRICTENAALEVAPDRGWSLEAMFASGVVDARHSDYFGRFATLLKGSVSAGGSELGLGMTLFALAVSIRATSVVEIGRFKGFGTLALASALRFCAEGWEEVEQSKQRPDVDYAKHESTAKPRRLISIDPHPLPEADMLLKQAGVRDLVTFIDKPSGEVQFTGGKVDLLFIDGDHTYEGCRRDAEQFIPHVRENGLVVLHDAFGWWQSDGSNGSPVKRVADDLKREPSLESVLVDTGYMSFFIFRKRCARHDAPIVDIGTRSIEGPFGPFIIPSRPEITSRTCEQMTINVWSGEYDSEGLPRNGIRTIVDVGAGWGAFAVWARWKWGDVQIDAYEPHAEAAHLLRRNDPRARVHDVAVTAGLSPLMEVYDDWGMCSLYFDAHPDPGYGWKETRRVVTLHPAHLPPVDLLKIDAEGAEPEIVEAYPHLGSLKVLVYEYHTPEHRAAIRNICERSGMRLVREDAHTSGTAIWVR
jgi:FkbM family methyltransferase